MIHQAESLNERTLVGDLYRQRICNAAITACGSAIFHVD